MKKNLANFIKFFIGRTAEKFANGTVAFALNDSTDGGTRWYQNIDKGEADSLPVIAKFGGEHHEVYNLASAYSNYRKGDLDRNDRVNKTDSNILLHAINGSISEEDFEENYHYKAADMNDDAEMNILDAIIILQETNE